MSGGEGVARGSLSAPCREDSEKTEASRFTPCTGQVDTSEQPYGTMGQWSQQHLPWAEDSLRFDLGRSLRLCRLYVQAGVGTETVSP